jgi:hypothetical protein
MNAKIIRQGETFAIFAVMSKNKIKRGKLAIARLVAKAERLGTEVPDKVLEELRWSRVNPKP